MSEAAGPCQRDGLRTIHRQMVAGQSAKAGAISKEQEAQEEGEEDGYASNHAVKQQMDINHLPTHLQTIRITTCPYFNEVLGADFYVVDTFGKGNCFFHAIAEAVTPYYEKVDAREREAIGIRLRLSFLKNSNEQTYYEAMSQLKARLTAMRAKSRSTPKVPEIPSYAVFERKLGEPSVWADLVMISFISHACDMNLVFFDDSVCDLYYGASRFDARHKLKTILINWRMQSHFELIVQIDPAGNVIKRQFQYPDDATVLDRLTSAYNSFEDKPQTRK